MQQNARKINPVILFAVFFGVLALIITVSIYSSTVSRNTIREQAAESTERTVSQVRDKLDSQLARIESLLKQVHFDPTLRDILKVYPNPPENEVDRLQLYDQASKILGGYSSTMKYIDGIHIFSDKFLKKVSTDAIKLQNAGPESRLSIIFDETNIGWLQKMNADERTPIWVPVTKNGFLRSANLSAIKDYAGPTFSIGKRYANIKRQDGQGFFIVINLNVKFLRELFQNVDLGSGSKVYVTDANGKIIYAKQEELIETQIPLDQSLIPLQGSKIVTLDGQEQLLLHETSVSSGWHVVGTLPTGQLFSDVTRTSNYMYLVLGLLVVVMAITYLLIRRFIIVQDRLQLQSAQLLRKNDELEQMDRLKDDFLANTSHELRTPINGIIGITESLVDEFENSNESIKKDLNMIINSGRRLSNLVNDILDFSKLRNSKLDLHLGIVDFPSALDMTLGLLKPLIGKKRLEIINELEFMKPAELEKLKMVADENRIQQILHNIISNAIKFTEVGRVEINAYTIGTMVVFQVSDTGIGIPEEKLDTIFNSFEQVDGSTARKYGGTGLGLSVTKQLVELHFGSIKAESQHGSWTRITVQIPMADPASVPSENNVQLSRAMVELDEVHEPDVINQSNEGMKSHGKVLVVDDEPINLQVILNHLRKMDYEVKTADNGIDAKEMIRNGYRPDLILLDVMMPKLSGFDLVRLLRREFPQEELPILLLTAKNTPTDVVTGFESGANDYLVKPFTKMELIARVDLHMNMAKKHRQLMLMSKNVMRLLDENKIKYQSNVVGDE